MKAQGSKFRSSEFILCAIPNVNSQSMWVLFPNRAKVMCEAGTQILGRLGQRVRKGEPGPEKPDDKTNIPWGLWQAASLSK